MSCLRESSHGRSHSPSTLTERVDSIHTRLTGDIRDVKGDESGEQRRAGVDTSRGAFDYANAERKRERQLLLMTRVSG